MDNESEAAASVLAALKTAKEGGFQDLSPQRIQEVLARDSSLLEPVSLKRVSKSVTYEPAQGAVVVGSEERQLRPQTQKLLELLLNTPNTIVRTKKLRLEMGSRKGGPLSKDGLLQAVRLLRRSLQNDEGKQEAIITRRGFGYMVVTEEEEP